MLCPVCGCESMPKNKVGYKYREKIYKLYICPECEAEFWKPLSDKDNPTMQALYSENPFFVNDDKVQKKLSIKHKLFIEHFLGKKGTLLDIGCGDGSFLYEASKLGFSVYGVDIDKQAVKFGREKYGLQNIYAMGLEEFEEFAARNNLRFDFITFFEVLEHQLDFKIFFCSIKRLLKTTSYVAGSVPNKDRAFADMARFLSSYELPPYHIMRFSEKSLRHLFKNENFDITIKFIKNKLINMGNVSFLFRNLLSKNHKKNNGTINYSLSDKNYGKFYGLKKIVTTGCFFVLSILRLTRNKNRVTHFYFEGRLL